MVKRIVIGADHGGFSLKEKIKSAFKRRYKFDDIGTYTEESCDYPTYGFNVAEKVSRKKAARGIVICKTGIGMAIIANKYPGVRAGVCSSVDEAVSARQHNDTNILVLAATKLKSKKAMGIITAWLNTPALGGRHARRVRQIRELEKKVFKS